MTLGTLSFNKQPQSAFQTQTLTTLKTRMLEPSRGRGEKELAHPPSPAPPNSHAANQRLLGKAGLKCEIGENLRAGHYPSQGLNKNMTCQLGIKKSTPLSSPKGAGLEVEGASGYTCLFTIMQRKGQGKEGREARPASSHPLLFPRTQSSEAQGTAGAGEQNESGKESGATEKDPPLTTNLGRSGGNGSGCGRHSQTSEISTQSTSPHIFT